MGVCVCVCHRPLLSKPAISMGVWSRCCRRGQASGEAIERGQRHRLSGGGTGTSTTAAEPPCVAGSRCLHVLRRVKLDA